MKVLYASLPSDADCALVMNYSGYCILMYRTNYLFCLIIVQYIFFFLIVIAMCSNLRLQNPVRCDMPAQNDAEVSIVSSTYNQPAEAVC